LHWTSAESVAGLKLDDNTVVALVSRWEGKESNADRPIFSAQRTPGKNRAVMLRTPQYKYTRYDDGGSELYDLDRDPDELDNRVDSAEYAQILAQLKGQLDQGNVHTLTVSDAFSIHTA
jgi:arylsulfatase A-like enzyme